MYKHLVDVFIYLQENVCHKYSHYDQIITADVNIQFLLYSNNIVKCRTKFLYIILLVFMNITQVKRKRKLETGTEIRFIILWYT